MKKILTIFFILFLIIELFAEINFPGDNFIQGWKKSNKTLRFKKKNLYDHINGAAELFLEFGFEELIVQKYQQDETEIVVEVYKMECSESALGIYLMKCGNETSNNHINARNSANPYQVSIVKGSYFILINNFSGDESILPAIIKLSNQILSSIPQDDQRINLFKDLPQENLVSSSKLIIRGPYALQPIYTFGEGDILKLGGKIFGVVADYKQKNDHVYTLIRIKYSDRNDALSAYKNLIENLDSYLKILEKWEHGFIFEDYQDKFGEVQTKQNMMNIKIKLANKPN